MAFLSERALLAHPEWRRRYPTARIVLPAAAVAVAVAAVLLIPASPMPGGVAVLAVALGMLLFALPSRAALLTTAGLAAAIALIFGALYAARAIGAL